MSGESWQRYARCAAAGKTRTTLDIRADDVDAVGIMFADTYVKLREVSYVAFQV